MSTRHLALVVILGITLFVVDMFVSSQLHEEVFALVILSICLVVVATFALWRSQKRRAVIGVLRPRVWEVVVASVGIAYCAVMAVTFVALLSVGYAAVDPIVLRWVPVLIVAVTAAVYPVARRWLR